MIAQFFNLYFQLYLSNKSYRNKLKIQYYKSFCVFINLRFPRSETTQA